MAEQMMQETAGKAIPAGYQQTEVGVIPEDWEATTVGQVTNWLSGGTPNRKREDYWQGDIPWISGSTLKTLELETSDQFLTSEGVEAGSKMAPLDATLLLVRGSALHSEIRAGLVVAPLCFNQDVKALIPNKSIVPRYLTIYLLAMENELLKLVSSAGNSAGVLDTELVKNFKFLQPPKHEQTAIANVLSDSDALIGALEQLIAKKQAIKTATMQQLLTGRTRLPQFALRPDGIPKGYKTSELGQIPKDWEVLAIDDCATKVGSGKTPNGGASVYIDAGRPFVRSQNIGWGKLILDDVAYISDDIHNTFSGSEIKEGDVLLNITGASIGRCAITEGYIVGGNVNQHVCIIRLNSVLLNARLLVELINSRNGQKQIDSYQAGGNREGLNFQQVRQLKFAVSNSSVEQTAIATILSDMDNELTALEQKLAKARDLKQGMMQQLLTGRIRLPLPKEA
ncbi:restriction endonuclease subunit S [Aeromonas allosaccharophila]